MTVQAGNYNKAINDVISPKKTYLISFKITDECDQFLKMKFNNTIQFSNS